jgi:hypothetical protein
MRTLYTTKTEPGVRACLSIGRFVESKHLNALNLETWASRDNDGSGHKAQ